MPNFHHSALVRKPEIEPLDLNSSATTRPQIDWRASEMWPQSNLISDLTSLSNRYFGVRHLESVAVRDRIVTTCSIEGSRRYELSPDGFRRGSELQEEVRALNLEGPSAVLSAGSLRANSTASFVQAVTGAPEIVADIRFTERFLGTQIEGRCVEPEEAQLFERALKLHDNSMPCFCESRGCESILSVATRVTEGILHAEASYHHTNIFVVSSRLSLGVLEACFLKLHPGKSWDRVQFGCGEVRELFLA